MTRNWTLWTIKWKKQSSFK